MGIKSRAASLEGKAVRHVRTPAGVRKYGQPIGSVIVADGTSQMMNEHGDYELPLGLPNPVAEVHPADRPRVNAKLPVRESWKEFSSILDRLHAIYDMEDWTEQSAEKIKIAAELRNKYDIDISYDPDVYAAPDEQFAVGVADGLWKYWQPCKDIRRAAWELLGYNPKDDDPRTVADPALFEEPPDTGWFNPTADNPEVPALFLLNGVHQGHVVSDAPAYRGVTVDRPYDFVDKLKEGDTFDMPLASFSGYRKNVERFGTDVTFVLMRGAKGVQGGFMGMLDKEERNDPDYSADDIWDDWRYHEFVSGGRFKIVRVFSTAAGYTVVIKQIGTFDPATGIVTKDAGKSVPWFDWAFDYPLARPKPKPQKKELPEFKDYVRTQAGVERYHQPIGSFIVKDAVLPFIDVYEVIPGEVYHAQVHGGPQYTVRKEGTHLLSPPWYSEEDDSSGYWPDTYTADSLKDSLQYINDQYDPDWARRVELTPPPTDLKPSYDVGGYLDDDFTVGFNAKRIRKTLRSMYEDAIGDLEIDDPALEDFDYAAFETTVIDTIRSQYQDANDHTTVFVPDEDTLKRILIDGRFKSQFESGTSNGLLNNHRREMVEYKDTKQMGVPLSVKKKERPIYGAVEADAEELSIASRYGRVAVEVSGVRDRVTATLGDSLDWELIPVTPEETDPDRILASAAPHAVRYLARGVLNGELDQDFEPNEDDRYYIEVQVHGGLSVDNISAVAFPYAAYDTEDEEPPSRRQVKRLLEHMCIEAYNSEATGWGGW